MKVYSLFETLIFFNKIDNATQIVMTAFNINHFVKLIK